MKFFFRKSLRVRLMLLVLVAVIPAWGVIAYTASEQKRIAVAEIQKNVLRLAEFSAREEELVLQGTRQILIALANFVRKADENPTDCSAFCTELIRQFKRYANLGAVKSNGDVFCSAVPLGKPMNVRDQKWFHRAVESGEFIGGDYHVGRITGKPVLVLSYPFRVVEGGPVTVAFAALDLNWLNRYVFEIEAQLPEGSTVTQIDEKAVVLAHHPDAERWLGRSMIQNPVYKEILAQKTGVIEARDENETVYIYAFAPLQSSFREQPVYMILAVPERLAFADSNRILGRNLILLCIVALAALLAAWFGSELFIIRQIRGMAQASERLASGEMSARTGLDYGSSEVGQLAKTFDEMATALEQRQAERRQAEKELQRSQMLFRSLSTHLQEVREEERTRIARKIHDDMGQTLTALKIDLSWINKRLLQDQDGIRTKLKSMVSLIDETIETVHNVSEDLRPGILDDFGLAAAIEWQAEEFQKRTGTECRTRIYPDEFELSKEIATNLFRIVQESLTNVIRHANATKVEIKLALKDSLLQLEVFDNGKGITEAHIINSTSFGLIGIKERVHSLGGEMEIAGTPNKGTRLKVTLSISQREDSHD
jgi:signal transduction histidine kinase